MIFFHGTIEENLKKIKKHGLLSATKDQWILEVTKTKVCCISNHPTSGEGGNAAYFAYGNEKIKNQNGYLVVLDIPKEILAKKLITIFDNKILDDYVRLHFFPREEFRKIGRELWLRFNEYRTRDRYLKKVEIDKRSGKATDRLLYSPQDQRYYYKKIKDKDSRYIYQILGIEMTDEFYDLIQIFGEMYRFYQFLQLHFEPITPEQYQHFNDNAAHGHEQYWRSFYQRFPLAIKEMRQKHLAQWFSPQWLADRQLAEPSKNCQILTQEIEPDYILGFIKITTPSGFAGKFRSCRSNSGFSHLVWQYVHEFQKKR